MQNHPNEKTIKWDSTYKLILGINNKNFYRVFEDGYEEKFQEISNILRVVNDSSENSPNNDL